MKKLSRAVATLILGIAVLGLGVVWLARLLQGSRRWRALDTAIRREGWKIVLLSQVHPLFPTSLLNYLYGVTSIRFWPCMLWIAVGQFPGLFLYAYLGTLAQLGIRLVRGQTHPHPVEYVVWFGGLALTVAVTTALGRLALRLLAEVDRAHNEPETLPETPPNPVQSGDAPPIRPASVSPGDAVGFDSLGFEISVSPSRYV